MNIEIKDIIYIAMYVASIAIIWTNLKNKVANLETKISEIKSSFDRVLYTQQGALNLMSPDQCEKHRTEIKLTIDEKIDKIENKIDTTNDKLEKQNEKITDMAMNILLIATELKVDVKRNKSNGVLYEES